MVSYPINFAIYCGMSRQFRETFKEIFIKPVSSKKDGSSRYSLVNGPRTCTNETVLQLRRFSKLFTNNKLVGSGGGTGGGGGGGGDGAFDGAAVGGGGGDALNGAAAAAANVETVGKRMVVVVVMNGNANGVAGCVESANGGNEIKSP